MSDSITRIGATFIFFLFIVIISYFVMSGPVDVLFSGFESADFGEGESHKDTLMPIVRTCFNIAMALLVSIPVTWLVMKIFSREPSYYKYRRY